MKKVMCLFVCSVLSSTLTIASASVSCKVDLKNGHGQTLETFKGYGYTKKSACREALRDCNRTIKAGYYRERNLECEQQKEVANRPRNQQGGRQQPGEWSQKLVKLKFINKRRPLFKVVFFLVKMLLRD